MASLKVSINIENCEKHCVRKLQCNSFWKRINTRSAHTTYNFPSGSYCKFSARDSTRASLTCKYQAADDGRGDFHSRVWGMQQDYMRITCMCIWQCCARFHFHEMTWSALKGRMQSLGCQGLAIKDARTRAHSFICDPGIPSRPVYHGTT